LSIGSSIGERRNTSTTPFLLHEYEEESSIEGPTRQARPRPGRILEIGLELEEEENLGKPAPYRFS
jgi:hypothetical protein